ncbi:MAG: zinc ribbon domain-containing protein, partial [Peptostreptococcaceae bacterium]
MKICKYCGKQLNKEDKFCDNCGKSSEYQPQSQNNKRTIIIILSIIGAILITSVLLYFSKDKLMYSYYLKKGESAKSPSSAIEYYLKGLDINYTQELVDKINIEAIKDDNFENTLNTLKSYIKKEDLDNIYIDKYVYKAEEKFENENYEICRIYLNKACSLGYEDTEFKYYSKLKEKEYEKTTERENQNTVVNNYYESNDLAQISYIDYYIIYDSNVRYLTESE